MRPDDLNDKKSWCREGLRLEEQFIQCQNFTDVSIQMNPSKAGDPFTYDMRINMPCDLKTITTPWVHSEKMFGIPSAYAISINRKDLRRYYRLYPNIVIVMDVRYPEYAATHWSDMFRLERLVKSGRAKLHEYKGRKDDTNGNAKDSYIFDARWFPTLY